MSRRTVISCDNCGRDIPGTVSVTWQAESYALAAKKQDGKFASDVCVACASKLRWVGFVRKHPIGWTKEDCGTVDTSASIDSRFVSTVA